jgi:hypothetical protein
MSGVNIMHVVLVLLWLGVALTYCWSTTHTLNKMLSTGTFLSLKKLTNGSPLALELD